MRIEQQRWAPLSGGCSLKPGGFGWSHPLPSTQHDAWWEVIDAEDHELVFHLDYRDDWASGSFLKRSCTEFTSYPKTWIPISQDVSTINAYLDHGFGTGKHGRLIDIDGSSDGNGWLDVIMVPNYGQAARSWWWSPNASAQDLKNACAGKAWQNHQADGITKKIASIARKANGNLAFILNQPEPGEDSPYFGIGVGTASIKTLLNGGSWGGIPAGPERRLVYLKLHAAPDNWTFLMVPRHGLGWHWWEAASWNDIKTDCEALNRRLIHIDRYGNSDDLYTAIVVQNN